ENPENLLGKIEVLRPFVIEDVPNVGTVSEQPHIKISAYYRLLIPTLLPNHLKKAIYLDSDVIVLGDLGELWDMNMGENYLLAVQDIPIPYVSSPGGLINYQELGLAAKTKYLQSGVLVIDLEKWRIHGTSQQCIEYLQKNREYVRWHDTDVLNAILAGKWGELDPRWNQTPFIYQYSSWKESSLPEHIFHELIHHPYIVHFVSPAKPWNSREEHPFRHLFFHYLDRTAWSGWRLTIWRRLWRRLVREIKQLGSFGVMKKPARVHS
ncbi:MAG TPA: glycosyltransferase family 8 protein, partial [Allocoleopsis sp.]